MITAERRNKNHWKTPIDYDINVYVREEYNSETGDSYWNDNQWYLHVYEYNDGDQFECSTPFLLTREESFVLNFVDTGLVDAGLDGWTSMEYLMSNYRDQMSDRVLQYLESFPKYKEDIQVKLVY